MIPTIAKECSQFLKESSGKYLVKNLSRNYNGFEKIKVRLKKKKDNFSENFNNAFRDKKYKLHQRAIFAYTNISLLDEADNNMEPFYIFPIDGYNILYNPEIENSEKDYETFEKMHLKNELISEQLQMSYKGGYLSETINFKCEIVIYGIPYYYALRASLIENYKEFFKKE